MAMRPPRANFLYFMQFLGEFDQIIGWRPPPLELRSLSV